MDGVIFLFSLCLIALTGSDKYRYDYTYDHTSKGWFKLHIIPTTWSEARLHCDVEGATLASPTNENMLASLVARIKNLKSEDIIYTGISARYFRGQFYSIEGIPLNRMSLPWSPNEPNNYRNKERCIVLTKNGCIADINCDEVFPFVCFKKAPESVKINECGTTDNEYRLYKYTGNCYKFHTMSRNWSRAYMTCSGEGAYLAIPDDPKEANYLADLFAEHLSRAAITTKYKDTTFLGFYNPDHDGHWYTIFGNPLEDGFAIWDPQQPDGFAEKQFCGAMSQSGLLYDMWCSTNSTFICEKDPKSLL